jgi:hypothetical protein
MRLAAQLYVNMLHVHAGNFVCHTSHGLALAAYSSCICHAAKHSKSHGMRIATADPMHNHFGNPATCCLSTLLHAFTPAPPCCWHHKHQSLHHNHTATLLAATRQCHQSKQWLLTGVLIGCARALLSLIIASVETCRHNCCQSQTRAGVKVLFSLMSQLLRAVNLPHRQAYRQASNQLRAQLKFNLRHTVPILS